MIVSSAAPTDDGAIGGATAPRRLDPIAAISADV
jgi:hypothetical protein